MHYGDDVDLLLAKTPEQVLQRFALDCAERAIAISLRGEGLSTATAGLLRVELEQKRLHVTTGSPDRAAMLELLEAHQQISDRLPDGETDGCDEAVCAALDVSLPVAEAAREAARGVVLGAWHEPPRHEFIRAQRFFHSDNEEFWQLRRLKWLTSLAADALWRFEESSAPAETRIHFDAQQALESCLQRERALPTARRERLLAEIVVHAPASPL
ncbi:hypothetical protein OV203_32995 [Nannocystis sp. ILAH1]|uniref:hypothetical protein n=1 Tax=Nannocystis sp. ILAH1 TaxID=2996789 RepID=UPI0022700C56|nr:hypothetical protein [Nannocystis sp. ILAH1]MCY0992002.1 hypothetical protein [Nannocystis sp. ILAH1]